MPILDNYLFKLSNGDLTITASDLESTMITSFGLDNADGDGTIAVPAKILNDTLKEFPEQPLSFLIDLDSSMIDILSDSGKFSIPGMNGEDYPVVPSIAENAHTIELNSEILLKGITKTLFATADDELRPVMNGIFIELAENSITFVASDAHKLVRYRRTDVASLAQAGFILPKKPANLIKNIVDKIDSKVILKFDSKNAYVETRGFKLICRLIEGEYPKYENVIPFSSPNKMVVERSSFINTLKRVSVFSSQASNLIKLKISNNLVVVSAQDLDFSISAYERSSCNYEGEDMEIGFKSVFLVEILNNLSGNEVVFEMNDPGRAGIILPVEKYNVHEDVLMLIMPMMVS
jgi:DNA polymerase-3 subunit beta